MTTLPKIKTSSWSTPLPPDHLRIGISRSVPRGPRLAGYKVMHELAPGSWFNSVSAAEYDRRYREEILARLDPLKVAAKIRDLAGGRVAVLLCFEQAGRGEWCHRAMVATWLSKAIGEPVPEYGFENLPQDRHPLLPRELRAVPLAMAVNRRYLRDFVAELIQAPKKPGKPA